MALDYIWWNVICISLGYSPNSQPMGRVILYIIDPNLFEPFSQYLYVLVVRHRSIFDPWWIVAIINRAQKYVFTIDMVHIEALNPPTENC